MRRFLLTLILVSGCKDDPTKSYESFQLCFDDQTDAEKLPVVDAIVKCCLEHPIAGITPACKDTEPDCVNFLTDNLSQTSASTVDVMDACQMYIDQKKMPM